MSSVRIFVSYVIAGDPRGTEMANRLIADLQVHGAEIVTVPWHLAGQRLIPFLHQELPSCQCLVLIQTPASLQSAQVQTTLQVALDVLDQEQLVRFLAVPSDLETAPPVWGTLRAFDASQDYPRMREKLLLELGLSSLDRGADASFPDVAPASSQFKAPAAVPLASREPLAEERTHSGFSSSSGHLLDRPTRQRTHLALFSRRGSSSLVYTQRQPHTDRPAALSQRRSSAFTWKTVLSCFLVTLLIFALGLVFSQRSAGSQTTYPTPSTQPTRTHALTAPVVSHPTEPTTMVLVQDAFQRPDQPGWGTSSDGHPWGADATNGTRFSIHHNSGIITGGQGPLNATVGQSASNAEVFFTGSISLFKQTNIGAVLRWVDPTTFYKAYLDGQQLFLLKDDGGTMTPLASIPFPAAINTLYDLRFRVQGATLSARAWPAGSPEPAQWMLTAQDATIQSGLGGLRVVTAPGITITITAFLESSAV